METEATVEELKRVADNGVTEETPKVEEKPQPVGDSEMNDIPEEALAVPMVCNWCQHDPNTEMVIEPTSEDKMDFCRAVLSDSRWKKTFYFGEQVKVTFQSPTVEESDSIMEETRKFNRDNMVPVSPLAAAPYPYFQLPYAMCELIIAGETRIDGETNIS